MDDEQLELQGIHTDHIQEQAKIMHSKDPNESMVFVLVWVVTEKCLL